MDQQGLHVAVVGAGIVGVATAIWLQRGGARVTLIDRVGPAGRTSHGNAGVLAAASVVPVTVPGIAGKLPRMVLDPDQPVFLQWRKLPTIARDLTRFLRFATPERLEPIHQALSLMLHDTYDQHRQLADGTGAERYITPGDYVLAYRNSQEFQKDAFAWGVRERLGHPFDIHEGEEVADYDPALAGRFGLVVAQPDHGRISDPGAYTTALAEHFVREGGTLTIADVRTVTPDGHVETGDGMIEADRTVITGGVWSRPLLRRLGIDVPVVAERGYHIEFQDPPSGTPPFRPRMPTMVASAKFVFTPMDGRLRCAGVAEFGGTGQDPSRAPFALMRRKALAVAPELAACEQVEWMGHRPSLPDSLPVIGAVPGVKNVFTCMGHQHVGLSGAPKSARWLSQLVLRGHVNIDLAPYAASRFNV